MSAGAPAIAATNDGMTKGAATKGVVGAIGLSTQAPVVAPSTIAPAAAPAKNRLFNQVYEQFICLNLKALVPEGAKHVPVIWQTNEYGNTWPTESKLPTPHQPFSTRWGVDFSRELIANRANLVALKTGTTGSIAFRDAPVYACFFGLFTESMPKILEPVTVKVFWKWKHGVSTSKESGDLWKHNQFTGHEVHTFTDVPDYMGIVGNIVPISHIEITGSASPQVLQIREVSIFRCAALPKLTSERQAILDEVIVASMPATAAAAAPEVKQPSLIDEVLVAVAADSAAAPADSKTIEMMRALTEKMLSEFKHYLYNTSWREKDSKADLLSRLHDIYSAVFLSKPSLK